MADFKRIADFERPAALRMALYGLLFVLGFFTLAAAVEELGWTTNVDFGVAPFFTRRLLIGMAVFVLPALVVLPDLGFTVDFDQAARRLRVTRLLLFWTRAREWDLASTRALRARRRIKALRVVYDVELAGPGSEGPTLFSLGERAAEKEHALADLAARLGLPVEWQP